jgi:DNA-binding NarL/FixJ family response regulator
VKGHVNHVFAKLKVTDRTKALVVAIKRGLIQID